MIRLLIGFIVVSLATCTSFAQIGSGPAFPSGYNEMYDHTSAGTNVTLGGETLFLPSSMDHGYQYPYVSSSLPAGSWTFPEFDSTETYHPLIDVFEEHGVYNRTAFNGIMNYVLINIMSDGIYDAPSNLTDDDSLIPHPLIYDLADAISNDTGCAGSWEELQELYSNYDPDNLSQCEILYIGLAECFKYFGYRLIVNDDDETSFVYSNCIPSMDFYPNIGSEGTWIVSCNCQTIPVGDIALNIDPAHPVETTIGTIIDEYAQAPLNSPSTAPYIQIIKNFEMQFLSSVHAMWTDANTNASITQSIDDYDDRTSAAWLQLIGDLETQWNNDTNN